MSDDPMIYDSQLGEKRPLEECSHMTEEWLDNWDCIQTTLDALEAARRLEESHGRLALQNAGLIGACKAAIADGPHNASHGLNWRVVEQLQAAVDFAEQKQGASP